MYTINEDHVIYDSWNIRCNRQKFSTFWAIFLHFQLFDKLENQNFNIEKASGDIIILHICTINDNHIMYGSWDMEHVIDRIFFHYGPFFANVQIMYSCSWDMVHDGWTTSKSLFFFHFKFWSISRHHFFFSF